MSHCSWAWLLVCPLFLLKLLWDAFIGHSDTVTSQWSWCFRSRAKTYGIGACFRTSESEIFCSHLMLRILRKLTRWKWLNRGEWRWYTVHAPIQQNWQNNDLADFGLSCGLNSISVSYRWWKSSKWRTGSCYAVLDFIINLVIWTRCSQALFNTDKHKFSKWLRGKRRLKYDLDHLGTGFWNKVFASFGESIHVVLNVRIRWCRYSARLA